MFENYREMSDAEKAQVKSVHRALRALPQSRYRNLAWAFVRGMKYRRVERTTRTQTIADGSIVAHNKPSARALVGVLGTVILAFQIAWNAPIPPELIAWLEDTSGAIAAPKPRSKRERVAERAA